MAELLVIYGDCSPEYLKWFKDAVLEQVTCRFLSAKVVMQQKAFDFERVLLLCSLNEIGRDFDMDQLVRVLKLEMPRQDRRASFYLGFAISSDTEFYTKSYARWLALSFSLLGANVIGKPLVEFLPGYVNYKTWKKTLDLSLSEIAQRQVLSLCQRLIEAEHLRLYKPKCLVIHACKEGTSNTLLLWREIAKQVKLESPQMAIKEIYMERGSITDCIGCDYETCVSAAKSLDCIVGGQYVDEIMPALDWADIIVWLCPNYNDSISADLMAVINRMSGYYRTRQLSSKRYYGIIVSGNSGSDTVAQQLIGALTLNKGFGLPPYFCMTEIASEPCSILRNEGINQRIQAFSRRLVVNTQE